MYARTVVPPEQPVVKDTLQDERRADFGFAKDLLEHYTTLHTDAALMAIAQNFPCELSMLEEYTGTDVLQESFSFASVLSFSCKSLE
ncbi:hypothetical protein L2E82_51993 [Cichorium intybus]|nr:hypothetical protein L2E82_51993 [Cichorium intybus]